MQTDYNKLLGYLLMMTVHGKAHRPAVAENMILSDVLGHSKCKGFVIVYVKERKTSQSAAAVTYTQAEYKLLMLYMGNWRPTCPEDAKTPDKSAFFRLSSGCKLEDQAGKIVQRELKKVSGKFFTATQVRKSVETASRRTLTVPQQEKLSKALGLAKKKYVVPDPNDRGLQ